MEEDDNPGEEDGGEVIHEEDEGDVIHDEDGDDPGSDSEGDEEDEDDEEEEDFSDLSHESKTYSDDDALQAVEVLMKSGNKDWVTAFEKILMIEALDGAQFIQLMGFVVKFLDGAENEEWNIVCKCVDSVLSITQLTDFRFVTEGHIISLSPYLLRGISEGNADQKTRWNITLCLILQKKAEYMGVFKPFFLRALEIHTGSVNVREISSLARDEIVTQLPNVLGYTPMSSCVAILYGFDGQLGEEVWAKLESEFIQFNIESFRNEARAARNGEEDWAKLIVSFLYVKVLDMNVKRLCLGIFRRLYDLVGSLYCIFFLEDCIEKEETCLICLEYLEDIADGIINGEVTRVEVVANWIPRVYQIAKTTHPQAKQTLLKMVACDFLDKVNEDLLQEILNFLND